MQDPTFSKILKRLIVSYLYDKFRGEVLILLAFTESKGLCEMKPPSGTFIQFSCGASQTLKSNSENDRHSLFTKHLLMRITQENLQISNAFCSIVDTVYAESNHEQKPLSLNGLPDNWNITLNEVRSGK